VKRFCTYHEYRFSLGLASLVGVLTGLADVAIEDWSVKAFVWAGILFFYNLIISYEFIVMPTPPKPLFQALLFILVTPMGLLSAHHWTWYILTIMLGKPIEFKLWLAPNIYADLSTYNTFMLISFLVYLLYLIIANFMSCEKEYEH
jgi:hypothetical protein